MKYTLFPETAEPVSSVGLGTWVFGGENWGGAEDAACIATVGEALDSGITLIDTAPFYSDGRSEALIGEALHGRRERAFVATKCGLLRAGGRVRVDLSPASIIKEADASLERLQCGVLDLYQTHWPDKTVPIGKTMEALMRLQTQGKVRHIGVCNLDLAQLKTAVAAAPVRTLQIQYSLLERSAEREILPFCRAHGVGVIAYGALGGGILTGKYAAPPALDRNDARRMFYRYYEGKGFDAARRGLAALEGLGRAPAGLALAWVRQQPGILSVLAGCRTPDQARANAAAAEETLSRAEQDLVARAFDAGLR